MARTVEFANVSHPGLKRAHNEDSSLTDADLGLALVADGMGGYKSGEVASAIAAQAVLDGIRQTLGKRRGLRHEASAGKPDESLAGGALRDTIERANKRIFDTAHALPQCKGMGTTIVVALFNGTRVTLAHVGDSRIYRFRDKQLTQVTSDHSLIQEMIDRGFYSAEEAKANTPKNLVTRALGIDAHVQVDVQEQELNGGDIFLLCSDGLNDMVTDEEISLTLGKYGANLSATAEELVRLANQGGGKDNVTVVLARATTATANPMGGLFRKVKGFLKKG
jgi:protein phosphatase